ncbi:hypothetical protein [Actinoplanes sp. NPDC051851]|uniref:hypothetical protein n=1 Tax=Actinoplanes sp. NPDC051851 TaxID=3154753 RepID=UPI00342CF4D8
MLVRVMTAAIGTFCGAVIGIGPALADCPAGGCPPGGEVPDVAGSGSPPVVPGSPLPGAGVPPWKDPRVIGGDPWTVGRP